MIPDLTASLNAAAATWWDWFSAVAWQASLFIAAVALLDRLLGRHIWPQVRYAVWLLAFVKLLLPPNLASPLSVAGAVGVGSGGPVADIGTLLSIATVPVATVTESAPVASIAALGAVSPSITWYAVALLAWLAGMASLSVWIAATIVSIRQTIRRGLPAPDWMERALRSAARTAGVRSAPRLCVTDAVTGACVYGLFRPTVLVPPTVQESDAEHVFLHEFSHIRRGDLVVHAASVLVLCAFWMNPLVWYALRRTMHLRELCTDATVSRLLREGTPAYRETLLKAARSWLDAPKPALSPMGLLGLVEGPTMIIERLKHLTTAPWRNARLRSAAALAVAVAMAIFVLPMCETQSSDPVSSRLTALGFGTVAGTQWVNTSNGPVTFQHTLAPAFPVRPGGDPREWSREVRGQYVSDYRAAVRIAHDARREYVRLAIAEGRFVAVPAGTHAPLDTVWWDSGEMSVISFSDGFGQAHELNDGNLFVALWSTHFRDTRLLRRVAATARERGREHVASQQNLLEPAVPIVLPPVIRVSSSAGFETIDVHALVDVNGRVEGASAGPSQRFKPVPEELRDAAISAALSATFEPAARDGVPIRVSIKIPVKVIEG